MRRFDRKRMNVLTLAALGAGLGACTSDINFSDINLVRSVGVTTSSTLAFQGARDTFTPRPVTSVDLVDAQGQCSAAPAASTVAVDASGQPVAAPASVAGGIALQMTECEVVQRAGVPDGIEFGSDRSERSVTLTYTRGARPGIYRFAGGRLVSIERGAEPQSAPKPQKKSTPAKKRAPA